MSQHLTALVGQLLSDSICGQAGGYTHNCTALTWIVGLKVREESIPGAVG